MQAVMVSLGPGVAVAERFVIEYLAAGGGMGMVFRAHDRQRNRPVALKVLRDIASEESEARFLREADLIAGFQHPNIVSYVAHGRTPAGQLFLAMEWIEGEDLARRLARRTLSVPETFVLARAVASILGTIHQQGIIHRDIKPSNLLLRDGAMERATLLDFGIARAGLRRLDLSHTREVLGTLHYLAPEQARGESELGPSVDVYALGCVLYECLTGNPPLDAPTAGELLRRILDDAAPSLSAARPDLPAMLVDLIDRMLDRDPARRPLDGMVLERELARCALDTVEDTTRPIAAGAPAATLAASRHEARRGDSRVASVLLLDLPDAPPIALDQLPLGPGAEITRLGPTRLLVTHGRGAGNPSARDLAIHMARLLGRLREHVPEATMVLATGPGSVPDEHQGIRGAVRTRAEALLEACLASQGATRGAVWTDGVTAGLVAQHFSVRWLRDDWWELGQEQLSFDPRLTLLGRPTACVGRDRELAFLDMLLGTAVEEGRAQAAIVLGQEGIGKSRLRHEFQRHTKERYPEVLGLVGQGDPQRAAAAYGLFGDVLMRWSGADAHTPQALQRVKLDALVSRYVAPAQAAQVIEFASELCGLAERDTAGPALSAARSDPRLMADQIARAVATLVGAAVRERPVVLILEDIHWADASTVMLVDTLLRQLGETALFVLAFARPSVREQFPRLWPERNVQELRLFELGRRAAERLVQMVLGTAASPETVAYLAARSGGNALFLEELIRIHVAAGPAAVPDTVLAILQGRLQAMAPGLRRLLRGASILGESFTVADLAAVLDLPAADHDEATRQLELLVQSEVLTSTRALAEGAPGVYGFRHALMRDAAYGLLDDEERRSGHRRVATHLAARGVAPAIVAEHFRQGGELLLAAPQFAEAARRASDGRDLNDALKWVDQAMACAPDQELRGRLLVIAAWAHNWSRQHERAAAASREALELLSPGSALWYRAVGAQMAAAGVLGDHQKLRAMMQLLCTTAPLAGAATAFLDSPLISAVVLMSVNGMRQGVAALLGRMDAVAAGLGPRHVRPRAIAAQAHLWACLALGDLVGMLAAARAAHTGFLHTGDARSAAAAAGHMGSALVQLGAPEAGFARMRGAVAELIQLKETVVLTVLELTLADLLLAHVAVDPARLDEARALVDRIIADVAHMRGFWHGYARVLRAALLRRDGDHAAALAEIRQAMELSASAPLGHPVVAAEHIRCLHSANQLAEAAQTARAALERIAAQDGVGMRDLPLYLAAAEALQAAGDPTAAVQAAQAGVRLIHTRAVQIDDPALRQSYLQQAPWNVRLLALAAAAA